MNEIRCIDLDLPNLPERIYPNNYVEINRGINVYGHWTVTVTDASANGMGQIELINGRIDGVLTHRAVTWLFFGYNLQHNPYYEGYDRLGSLHFRDQETECNLPTPALLKTLTELVEGTTLALMPGLFTVKAGKFANYLSMCEQVDDALDKVRSALRDAQVSYKLWAAESEPHV